MEIRNLLKSLTFAAALLMVPSLADAREIPGAKSTHDKSATVSSAAFTNLAINTAKTFDAMYVNGWDFLELELEYTWSAGTAVTMTCAVSDSSGGTFKNIQVLTYSGSTATSDTHTWSQAVSGDEDWKWTVALTGAKWIKCTFTATSGDANDTLSITRAVVGNQ